MLKGKKKRKKQKYESKNEIYGDEDLLSMKTEVEILKRNTMIFHRKKIKGEKDRGGGAFPTEQNVNTL